MGPNVVQLFGTQSLFVITVKRNIEKSSFFVIIKQGRVDKLANFLVQSKGGSGNSFFNGCSVHVSSFI